MTRPYRLRVGERTVTYDITRQSLWTAPLQFVRMLNEKLPDPSRRFEALTLLPIYGETLVFYLSREEKEMLEAKRGWQFFDWSTLEGNISMIEQLRKVLDENGIQYQSLEHLRPTNAEIPVIKMTFEGQRFAMWQH
jgi:hypothetical protein